MTGLSDPSFSIDMSLKLSKDIENVANLKRIKDPVTTVAVVDDSMVDVLT